ncbi:MAG: ATP-binding cassette domain-containing protein [Verrucomicrobiales bacterium]|nr:ATP-binding cassette domain-containing protein [Verrucomicrobiales bacterium]
MVKVENLTVRAGNFEISDVNFEIPDGKYGVLMGKTGCGKTTILEAICGLKNVVGGKIFVSEINVTALPAGARGIGFVPQDGSLFTTKTVRKHLAFGPRVHGWKREKVAGRVKDLAEDLGIAHLLDRKPHGLSGGERQRVSLGRALAVKPGVLCLDEPLSALDEDTHAEMVDLLKRLTAENDITVLHITHSRREAEQVADLQFRIEDGKVVQM